MTAGELKDAAEDEGYTTAVLRRAKDELKNENEIKYYQSGSIKERLWHVRRLPLPEEWLRQRS